MNRAIAHAMAQVMQSQKNRSDHGRSGGPGSGSESGVATCSSQPAEPQPVAFQPLVPRVPVLPLVPRVPVQPFFQPQMPQRAPFRRFPFRGGNRGRGRQQARPQIPALCRRCERGYHWIENCPETTRVSKVMSYKFKMHTCHIHPNLGRTIFS